MRERSELYRKIQLNTQFDLNAMRGDDEWLLQILIGVGCSQRQKRLYIQLEVAKYVAAMFRKRTRLLEQTQATDL